MLRCLPRCSRAAASVGFGPLHRLKEIVRAYLCGAKFNEDSTHRPCYALEFLRGFWVPMRLYAPKISPILMFFPSLVPFAVSHLFECSKNGVHEVRRLLLSEGCKGCKGCKNGLCRRFGFLIRCFVSWNSYMGGDPVVTSGLLSFACNFEI